MATAEAADGAHIVVWRWYDAVVLDEANGLVRMWEPAHGEVSARRRLENWHPQPGSRAYLPAGLPGADWWVAGPTTPTGEGAVELGDVEHLYTTKDLLGQCHLIQAANGRVGLTHANSKLGPPNQGVKTCPQADP
ncbi:hypothetical protein [uncultured Jatrophihabitans sp.]|uniref:hypothetical protein n=1 Tax=uncultured Jatrophihabitans sp. TaxID=1610747 RepID=UPI0035CA2941